MEGEKPSSINVKANIGGWGNKQFLSGEQWLDVSIDADKVDKELPPEGALIKYAFTIKKDGKYEVWNRIGFEFVRSPFAWRLDDGEWVTVSPEELTTDLMEIAFWTEVAWLKMGERSLSAGQHQLEIKLPRTKDAKGKTARVLYASDAICIHAGPFHPNSRYRPGEDAREPADREAAKKVFELPQGPPGGRRASVPLNGLWEVCRHDEQLPGETAQPIQDFPEQPHWKAIQVPGDKNTLRPDLLFAHRLWYRTRVLVPDSYAGRSFHLVFPQNNLNTTVYVNNVFCGFNKNPFARFEIDLTKGIKPGTNEIWVGIKDAWYGYSTNPNNPLKLRKKWNLPRKFFGDGFQDLAYPIWGHPESGILVAPEFVAAGSVYATDVFCKPSVARKELGLDVTVLNRSGKQAKGEVLCEAVDAKTGDVAKTLPAKPFTLAADSQKTLQMVEAWPDPKWWWPDDPNLYLLRATVKVDGQPVDVSDTPFGFREWTSEGKDFKLNGVTWHGMCDQHHEQTREQWLDFQRKSHQTTMRFWATRWYDLPPEAALTFFDRNGIVVRRSGMLDGEAIGYMAVENDPDLKKESPIKMDLMRNWRDQLVAQVMAERNHPSVMIWSIENEWLYINCINLYSGLMDRFEAEVLRTSDMVRAADPTHLTMTDGGGANKDNTMPVHGNHYVGVSDMAKYPALAYEANPTGGGRGRWVWDEKRPRYLGEDFYAAGIPSADFSYFGGERAFQGKAQARPAVALVARILTEGYRWAGYGAWALWMGTPECDDYYLANSPRAVFCRQWDWTFGSGQKVSRTLGIFNDTHSDDPITFTWSLTVGGKLIGGASSEHRVAPGSNDKFDLTLQMPQGDSRQEGELTLALSVRGKEVFRDAKAVSVLNPDGRGTQQAGLAGLTAKDLLVYDPHGSVAAFLKLRSIPFTPLADLHSLPITGKVLLVGKDALDPSESTSSRLAAYAVDGRRIVVLEQKNPLKYQGLPAEMEAASNEGTTAFPEDSEHPVLRGLRQKDFFTWGPDEMVYRNAYGKPARGGRSLIQCHHQLQNCGLAEVPVSTGLMLLCQLVVAEKLDGNAVAQQLLLNLLDYAAAYRLEYRAVVAAVQGDAQLPKVLHDIGLKYTTVSDPLGAISDPKAAIAVIAATPAHLKALAANLAAVRKFTEAGGWIIFNGLTPEGLADYNKIVGFDHMIRPFRRERINLPASRTPRIAGLTLSDVVMYSSERIFPWAAGNFVASDVFSYVVDFDDVAPFVKFPNDFLLNMVNGFVSADGWKYIVNVPAPEHPPIDWLLRLPKEQEVVELEWVGNTFYYPVTRVELIFDGKDTVSFDTRPNNDPQTFPIDPPRKGKDIILRLADWQTIPGKAQVTGVDNIRLKARRPPEFYHKVRPLLNVGGLVEYPQGQGGILLCNLLFKDHEEVPANFAKKRTIFATLLRNLKAPFSGGKTVIAGANLQYQPLDISRQANQFRDEKGWFGDRAFTFKDLPTGRQTFAGVPFEVYDFPTSPVPTVIMLGGPRLPTTLPKEVRGIPVNRKADALFFLHTARLDVYRNDKEVQQKKQYELFHYVVNYADGQKVAVPVYAEIDIAAYKQKTPTAIPGAQIAWIRPYERTPFSAVAYSKQWTNPRPAVEISSIDMAYGDPMRGVPVLIAVTAATAKP